MNNKLCIVNDSTRHNLLCELLSNDVSPCKEILWNPGHFCLWNLKASTLGARDFSYAVSGFGQVLNSDPREKFFLAADETKLPDAREKKLRYPR